MASEQLPLNIRYKLSYRAEQFVRHAGIKELLDQVVYGVSSFEYASFWIDSPRRFGKTHFSVFIASQLNSDGRPVWLLTGEEFADWLVSDIERIALNEKSVILIDDIDSYLNEILPGSSGPFVNFVEKARRSKSKLLFFSKTPYPSLPCDDHVMSRVRAAQHLFIGPPGEEDLESLIAAMATQRGILLSDMKRLYLSRRIGRDVPSIEGFLERYTIIAQRLGKASSLKHLAEAI